MKISVLIPYFKNIHTIERTLLSVTKQTYKPYEVLLINDASPDWEEAKKLISTIDLPLKVISHDVNKNGAAARNTGIQLAQGDWIAFLDADDEWYPDHLRGRGSNHG